MDAAQKAAQKENDTDRTTFADYDYSNFYYGAGDDPLNLLAPVHRVVRRGAAQRLLPLLRAAAHGARTPRSGSQNRKTGEVQDAHQPRVLQLPGHLVPRGGQGGGASRPLDKYGLGASGSPILSGTFDIHEELADGGRRASRTRKRRSCSRPATAPTSASSRRIMRAGRQHLLRPVLARLDRGRRDPGQVQDRLLPPQQPDRPGAQAERRAAARSWWWWRASTRWTATSACCPRSSRSPSATAPASSSTRRTPRSCSAPTAAASPSTSASTSEVDFHLGTFSKSLGGQGGFVCGSQELIDYVNAFGRSRFFSCNLAPTLAAGLARRHRASWRTSRSCARGSGATSPSCAAASPRRASTSASPPRR